ncbi:glycosyltransferase family 2 protein [Selenomonas sp. oral taxon 138]|uniref:glycosyltransferase family 2 protein n=1 Tax=Selenomonas sp. oral taxon 138 TaxID=712532 RepID=UPI0002A1B2CE|nr:glycosyltransferase family 2 protein [Selenomonas sp. oral taxon 138]EKX99416.1 putative bactoprenol glucosyl transferase-like protein [Selenomonas sp. oral taxon 138 str. F0429]
MKRVSIVVPVYNEEDNIAHFVQSVEKVMETLPYAYEILFIDDGSRDRSREILREMGERDPHVQSIFLARNAGHQVALTCGTDHADGDAVITMDGDMQHPPELLPVLLAKWEAGYEIVQTVRLTTEGASIFKRLTSKYYYRLLNAMTDVEIQEGGSDFRLMDRKAVLALRRYHEHARFIRGIVGAMGFRKTTVEFVAPERFAGQSKFSLHKMISFALDGILAYSVQPLRAAFYVGICSALLAVLLFLHVLYETLRGETVAGWSTIVVCSLFFGGMQMMMLGVCGEYIARILQEVKNRPLYLIASDNRRMGEQREEGNE